MIFICFREKNYIFFLALTWKYNTNRNNMFENPLTFIYLFHLFFIYPRIQHKSKYLQEELKGKSNFVQ